jgi:uncharacterized protein (TIGR02679 family)
VAELDDSALARLWAAVAQRLERNGLRPAGMLRLDGLERDERHALAGLLGRPVAKDRVTIDLSELDRRLRAGATGTGLVDTVARVHGPLIDRQGRRSERADAIARVWSSGRDALGEEGLAGAQWVEDWLEDVRRTGSLARVPSERAERALRVAVRCMAVLPCRTGRPACGRGELASLVIGDAHGLDDGTLIAAITLRGLARMLGTEYPSTSSGRRELWRTAGVLVDDISTTVLTAGLHTVEATWLDDRTDAGWESHLTARDLRRLDIRVPADRVVYVCENPRVLEAAIDAAAGTPMICTMGNPTLVVTGLLDRLVAGGVELRYHGDFDWAGITIANTMIGSHGCRPWRFEAPDYLAALGRLSSMVPELPELASVAVCAAWDAHLTEEMARVRRAVHEELVLDQLLDDLQS